LEILSEGGLEIVEGKMTMIPLSTQMIRKIFSDALVRKKREGQVLALHEAFLFDEVCERLSLDPYNHREACLRP
jgi:hypothetical protein